MALWYEVNPPKIPAGSVSMPDAFQFMTRLRQVSDVCGGVHITENVLGIRRLSPIDTGRNLQDIAPGTNMTLTGRVRDRGVDATDQYARDAVDAGFSGLLLVIGDRSPDIRDSGQVPSGVVRRLRQDRIAPELDLYLSVPANPNYDKMKAKIDSCPRGFMTQVVQETAQVQDISANLPGFHIVPILLYPSPKNHKAASFLNIDMSTYTDSFAHFVSRIHDITGDVLLTSPGDYLSLYEFLSQNRY